MEVRHVKGQTVYKQKDLRLLCQQFWLANRCPETRVINVKDHMTWDDRVSLNDNWALYDIMKNVTLEDIR